MTIKKTAIITGVSGQDGLYLARFLLEKDYRVIGTVRSISSLNIDNFIYIGVFNKIVIREINLLDKASIIDLIKMYRPNEIYNLAAQSSVGLSFDQPIDTFVFNTISVNNLLESIRLFKPDTKFYHASSSEIFGNVKQLPINIDTPKNPVSPYAVSKAAAHNMVVVYRNAYGIFTCNGVLFNHESFLRRENFFIKKVLTSAIAIKNKELNELRVGNLNIKRDFGFAPKYTEAMWRILQVDKPQDFIICSGESIYLSEIVYYIFDKLGIDKRLIVVDEKLFRPNEIEDIYGDNSIAKKKLNWNYNMSFFEVLDHLIEEHLENLNSN